MKKLLITLLLVSPLSFADWGDVYYCQMTNHVYAPIGGEATRFKLEKFQFKLDKKRQAMVFGKSGSFASKVKMLDSNYFYDPGEWWFARGTAYILEYNKGEFMYADLGIGGMSSVTANCDKF